MHPIALPEGYEARPAGRGDLEAVFGLVAGCERHDDGVAEVALSDIAADWSRPDFDLTEAEGSAPPWCRGRGR